MPYLVFFLLFILPLFVFPFGPSFFEPPKVILADSLVDILLIWTIFKKDFSFKKVNSRYLVLSGIIFLISLLHLIYFPTPTTLLGNAFRLQGVILLWHLLIWSIISSQISLNIIPGWGYLFSFLVLAVSAFLLGGNQTGRAVGTLGEPNALAAASLVFWPFIFFQNQLSAGLQKILKVSSLLLVLLIVGLSGSRSGLLALAAQLIFLALTLKLSLGKAVVITLALLVFSLALPILEGGGLYENRAEVWQTALVGGFYHPLLGGGFGNIESLMKKTAAELGNNIQYQYVDSAHNIILDFWLQAGLIGVIILLLMLLETFQTFIKSEKKLELTLFLGILTAFMFNPMSVVNLLFFWWLIGQGFSTDNYNSGS